MKTKTKLPTTPFYWARYVSGLSQAELGEKTGLHATTINSLENKRFSTLSLSSGSRIWERVMELCCYLVIPTEEVLPIDYDYGPRHRKQRFESIEGHDFGYEYPYQSIDTRDLVLSLLEEIPSRDSDVIKKRFALTGRGMSLEAIGQEYGLTRERVRQVEEKALDRMRIKLHMRGLYNVYDCV